MFKDSKFFRFLLRSPLLLLVFFIIPAAMILRTALHVTIPFRITTQMLLLNNGGLLLVIALRLLYYLSGLRREIRYGETPRPSKAALNLSRPAMQVRDDLVRAGFHSSPRGSYAEKHDFGYLGTVLVYGGLCLVLFVGTWENLYQFSGTMIQGLGVPADLNIRGTFFPLMLGPLAKQSGFPRLEVTKQYFPGSSYPQGASDVILWTKDGHPLGNGTIAGGNSAPLRFKQYDIYFAKMLVDAALKITEKGNRQKVSFSDSIKLSPLLKKQDGYSLYGNFSTSEGRDGEAYYNPDTKTFRFILTNAGKKVLDTEYAINQYREKEVGDFVLSVDALGNWSEIHVVRHRHMGLLWLGGICALLGLIMRVAIRPQRVWLDETQEGCRVWALGGDACKIVE